ncbi:hypothetical protein HZH66_013419 [Vespula vulgaris]|uniref:Uncharacterized protein n=1 Tax=Vespula vulgaris TaxID=7454 RepID=A0A834J7H1_VESVU|nr:hypothetical protein HZH66_013419 [Vespula vulgaris]
MNKDLTFSNFNLVVVAVQERLLGKVQHPISWTINIRCFFTTQTRVLAQVRRRNAIASSSFLFFEQCVTSDRGSQARISFNSLQTTDSFSTFSLSLSFLLLVLIFFFSSSNSFVKFTLIIFEISYLGLREKRREDKRRR